MVYFTQNKTLETLMKLLYFFESIRNPVLDFIFSHITVLGEQTAFIAFILLIYWCFSKKAGYALMLTGFFGTLINQTLKLSFRIPRPWVKDPDFTIVESARDAATGYSFPSGHTQSSVGTFGSIFYFFKNKTIRAICIILCILVPLSRMYLGVHTPADVFVSVAIAIALVLIISPITEKIINTSHGMYIASLVFIMASVAFLCFVLFFPFPKDIDPHNYQSGVKNAYMLLGVSLAFPLVYFIDTKFCKFNTEAPIIVQTVKFVLGLILALALLEGLKPVFPSSGALYGPFRALRYFIVFVVAGGLYPFLFAPMCRLYEKIKSKVTKEK